MEAHSCAVPDLATWVDRDSAGRLAWRGTPDHLARLNAAPSPFAQEQLTMARREGRDAPHGACASDLVTHRGYALLARDAGGWRVRAPDRAPGPTGPRRAQRSRRTDRVEASVPAEARR